MEWGRISRGAVGGLILGRIVIFYFIDGYRGLRMGSDLLGNDIAFLFLGFGGGV